MSRRRFWVNSVTLVVLLGSGCKSAPAALSESSVSSVLGSSVQGSGAPVLQGSEQIRIQVHPSLVKEGRIALVAAEAAGSRAARPVPGEVTLSPEGEAEVGSLVAGRIARIEVAAGDVVTKGQTLAWVEAPEVGAARAELERAEAQCRAAERRLERQRTLQKEGATSQGAFDEAETLLNIANADRKALSLRLKAMGAEGDAAQGNRVALRAPIAGVVSERSARLGMSTSADSELFHLVNLDELRVQARWPETAGTLPRPGTKARLVARRNREGTGVACSATVATQFGRVEPTTRSVTLSLLPSKDCSWLAPGGYLDVYVEPSTGTDPEIAPMGSTLGSSVRVPREAVLDVRGLTTVFVGQGELGSFVARTVVIQAEAGTDVLLESGVNIGEQVVVRGMIYLKGEMLRDSLGGE